MQTPVRCPVCDGVTTERLHADVGDFEYGTEGRWSWERCTGCDLVRLDPFPSSETLNAAYPPTYHTYVEAESGLTNRLRDYNWHRLAKQIGRYLEDGDAVLDIGCSRGHLLHAIGSLGHYTLCGVESFAPAAAEARRRGIEVYESFFEDADVPDGSFNVVLMWHVLEHVADPVAVMRKVVRALKPGGWVLGELPNYASWDAALFGRYWGGGHAPRHLWHFTPDSLRRTLRAAQVDEVKLRPVLHPGHFALSLQTLARRGSTATADLKSGRTWYFPFLSLALVPVAALQMFGLRSGVMQFDGRAPR